MDLLRWPVVRALARRRRARLVLQVPLLVLAAALVVHGLLGPQIAPRNLATVVSWVHYRGLLIVALLAVGNLFCTACPMMLVRDAGRRIVHPALRWPRVLRNKWPGLVLLVAMLFTYELFDLWSLPRATALLVLAYFAAALLVDVVFAGAAFCKYLCPIGQFNFVSSTLSPTEIRVRDAGTCRTCRTVDCIKGRREPIASAASALTGPPAPRSAPVPARLVQRGCELALFLPGKVGNLDCTLCLDCVHACPHDNVGLMTRVPGEELSEPGRRSGLGWLPRRADLAWLVVIFTFGALLNAFAMTAPASRVERMLAAAMGEAGGEPLALGLLFVIGLVLLPAALVAAAAWTTRLLTREAASSIRSVAMRYVYALVPLGVGVWAAHYGFHALTGALTIVPVTQSAALDLVGRPLLGEPLWTLTGAAPGRIYPIQLGCILLGAAGSLAVAHRISSRLEPSNAWPVSLPWAALVVLLAVAATWILGQPMDMRGVGIG